MVMLMSPVICFMLLSIASEVLGDDAMMSVGMQIGTALTTQAKLLCDQDGTSQACERGGYLLNGRVVASLTWENTTSFNDSWPTLDAEVKGQQVAVRVSQVKGDFTLPSNTNFVIVSLQLINLTCFTNHTQDLSSLEELIVSDSPEFDASSLQELGKLPSLVILEMAYTPLATLSNRKLKQVLKEMPSLQYLDISFCKLHHLEASTFQKNSKLQILNIAGNELISLSLDGGLLQQLVHLNMSRCSMEHLRIESMPEDTIQNNLSIVDLSHNYLTNLPASFMNIISESHVHLNISGNLWNNSYTHCSLYHLWNYATKHPDRIQGAQNLSCFRPDEALKKCGWEECPATCSCDLRSKTVNCTSSDLKSVPYIGPSDAEILLLKNNTLFNMTGIESPVWCKLKTVIADDNKISSVIPPDTMGHCTCFDHDDLDEEKGDCLPQSLQKLSLAHNKIENISYGDCKLLYSLRELHLSGNKVKHLKSHVCSSLERLEVLLLDNNSISDLKEQDVAPYPNLRRLNLAFNKMAVLPYRIFEFVPKLRALNVSNNSLRNISAKTSIPETPFTFMVTNFPSELDLRNNKFEMINSVLSLKYIPKLKMLLMDNNPWECHCKTVNSVMTRVFQELQHTAMVNAVESVICQVPSNVKGKKMNDPKITEDCNQKCSSSESELFIPIVAILIIIILLGLLVQVTFRKIRQESIGIFWVAPPRNDATHTRTHSVCIVHAWQDNEMVKADLVDPLTNLGYSVLWNESPYFPENIDRVVTNSRRMLVVASNHLMRYENAKRLIERGLEEECSVPGFKVVAFVMDDLPQSLYSVLYEIVVNREHIPRMKSNYIKEICNKLPPPGAIQNIITFTETDLYCFLLQQWEKAKKREHQRARLQDIFSSQNSDLHAGIASTSSASWFESGIAVSSITDDLWEAVRSRSQRRHESASATEEQLQTSLNQYTLQISCEDGEQVAQVECSNQVNFEGNCTHL